MSDTKIQWTDKSWNPITGCSKISEGCKNCYAERMSKRLAGRFEYPKNDPFAVTFHPNKLPEPLGWKKPQRVFVCSMGDLFHPDVNIEWIEQVHHFIGRCPWHTFQILTKRPGYAWGFYFVNSQYETHELDHINIHFGVTVENQNSVDRIEALKTLPFKNMFVSVEPMLENIHFRSLRGIGQVIVGGETGPGAREFNPDWALDVLDQCNRARVSFFFKHRGSNCIKWKPKHQVLEGYKQEPIIKY